MPLPAKKLTVLCTNEEAPSFRYRIRFVLPELERRGWQVTVVTLRGKRHFREFRDHGAQIRTSDVVYLSKTKLSWLDAKVLRWLAKKVVYDFDDAVYYRRPHGIHDTIGTSWPRQARFYNSCRAADLVLAGNEVLAAKAANVASRVEVLSTPVNVSEYLKDETCPPNGVTAVWIGLPTNLPYLEMIRPALAAAARRFPDFKLRIVSSRTIDWDEVPIEYIPWSKEGEIQALKGASFGLMPLTDDEWSRGKCAFKLLQYMSAGLPCIASPVGTNCEAVIHGKTGYLAGSTDEWEQAIEELVNASGAERENMGKAGQAHVLANYSFEVVGTRLMAYLEGLIE